jgi:hypothetical protein
MEEKTSTEPLEEIIKPSKNLNYNPPFLGCNKYVEEMEILKIFFEKVNNNP